MKALLVAMTLLLAICMMALQQVPPDTHPPGQSAAPNSTVQGQIEDKIAHEPALHGTNVKVSVEETSVTLTGTVDTEQQHALALRIAQSFAGDRPIEDKIQVRART